ncbi:MAG: DUF1223 domain-containing protein [Croceibacterium sp.]
MPSRFVTSFSILAVTIAAGLSAGSASRAAPASSSRAASAEHPIVVELFQSQGCSSCPPANAYLNRVIDRPEILALSFAVTYWDQLGWKDSFASPTYTARQQDYARAGRGEVATPEIIVNGTHAVLGSDRSQLDAALASAGPARGGPEIVPESSGIRIAQGAAGAPATVWLVRYDPRARQVAIRAGENGGKTLPHRGIVRQLIKLGEWTGPSVKFALPLARESGLATAALVQHGAGGPIIAARKL